MKRPFLPFCLLALLGFLYPVYQSSAQALLATSQKKNDGRIPGSVQETSDLVALLKRLEVQHKINFVYQRELLEGKKFLRAVNETDELETILNKVLPDFDLRFKKLKGGDYTILPARRSLKNENAKKPATQPETAPEATDSKTGFQSSEKPPLAPAEVVDREVSGFVGDESGNALPGVSVVLKSSQRGTITDSDGNFRLSVPDDGAAALVFSFIGYVSQEVLVGQQTGFRIRLKTDQKTLDELVVIGYGQQSRKLLSTAISKVEGQNIALQPVATPGDALAGLVSGVQVQSNRGGFPGDAPTIRVRGVGSLGTSSTPLYVVDGYPLQDPTQFNLINPVDIESIEILKDAASAAVYGSRAANGVVIVTTKRGKTGRTSFQLSAYTGVQQVAKKIDMMNRDQYIERVRLVSKVRKLPYPAILDQNPGSLPDTDWQDVIFRTGPISDFQLSANGGTEKVQFAVSGGYFNQKGTMRGTSYERYNLRFNLNADLSPKLKLGVSLAPSFSTQYRQPAGGGYNGADPSEYTGQAVSNPIQAALVMPPILPVYNQNGGYYQPYVDGPKNANGSTMFIINLFNPLSTTDLYLNRFQSYRLFGTSYLAWEPLKNLVLKTALGSTLSLTGQYTYVPASVPTLAGYAASATNPVLGNIYAREMNGATVDWLWENTATYTKTFNGSHNITLLALYSLQKLQTRNTATNGRPGTYTTDLITNPLASSDLVGTVDYGQNAFLSLGGRISYDYRTKYILTAGLRRDASSKFGPNSRFANFPTLSAAWRVSEEPFWQNLKNAVNELKIRASFGKTGNANIGDFTWASSIVAYNYSFNGQRTAGYRQSGLNNNDLTWEKNKQTDLGLEASFLNDRIALSADFYTRNTEGMLFQKDLPYVVGYAASYQTNIGNLQNRGFELSGRVKIDPGPVKWTVDANLSANRTKVLDLGGPSSLPYQRAIFGWNNVYQIRVGEPLGNMYGFEVIGLYKNQEDLTKYPKWSTGNKVGDWIVKDQNKDGVVNEDDRTLLGNGLPKMIYGLTNTLQFRKFDLTLILQGVQGINIIDGSLRQLLNSGTNGLNSVAVFADNAFDPDRPERDVEYHQADATGVTAVNNMTNKTIFDGSFFRARNLTLGYTFSGSLLNRIKLQSARMYGTVQNLFTITKYPGFNPEASVNGDSAYLPGVDISGFPVNRTMTVGVSIGF